MSQFARLMRDRALAVEAINERLRKIRYIFEAAKGNHQLPVNPAAETLGFKESTTDKYGRGRITFNPQDTDLLFGLRIFLKHERSAGQTGRRRRIGFRPLC